MKIDQPRQQDDGKNGLILFYLGRTKLRMLI